MAITLTNLQDALRARLSATADDAIHTATNLTQDINFGLAAFAEERDWPWLEALDTLAITAGDETTDVPATLTRIREIYIDTDDALDAIQYRDLQRFRRLNPTTPTSYALVGGSLYWAPTPVATTTASIFFQRTDNVLASGSDVTLVPVRFMSVAVTYAAMYSALRVRDVALQTSLKQTLDAELARTYDSVQRSSVGNRIITRRDTLI